MKRSDLEPCDVTRFVIGSTLVVVMWRQEGNHRVWISVLMSLN